MTKMQNRDKYLKLMNGMEIIESRLVDDTRANHLAAASLCTTV